MYHVWKEKNGTPPRRKNRGFTLIEMLTVTAITAVLVATSIPVVSGSLERAREATDMANERAAIAAGSLAFISGELPPSIDLTTIHSLYYDAVNGTLVKTAPQPYGKCNYHKDGYLEVAVKEDGFVLLDWQGDVASGYYGPSDYSEYTARTTPHQNTRYYSGWKASLTP